jgi:hypothetical protein
MKTWLVYYHPDGKPRRLKLLSDDEETVRVQCELLQQWHPELNPHVESSDTPREELLKLFGKDL